MTLVFTDATTVQEISAHNQEAKKTQHTDKEPNTQLGHCYLQSLNLRCARPQSNMGKLNDYKTDRHSRTSDTHICLFFHISNIKLIHLYPKITVPGITQ